MFIVELNLSCQQSASPQYHSFPVCPSIQLSPLPPQLKTMGALALPSFCSLIGMRGREKLMSQFREGNYCCIEAALLPLHIVPAPLLGRDSVWGREGAEVILVPHKKPGMKKFLY